MNEQVINQDQICQRAIQSKLDLYRGKEVFEAQIKDYNDNMDSLTLISVISTMKKRILELEGELEKTGNQIPKAYAGTPIT